MGIFMTSYSTSHPPFLLWKCMFSHYGYWLLWLYDFKWCGFKMFNTYGISLSYSPYHSWQLIDMCFIHVKGFPMLIGVEHFHTVTHDNTSKESPHVDQVGQILYWFGRCISHVNQVKRFSVSNRWVTPISFGRSISRVDKIKRFFALNGWSDFRMVLVDVFHVLIE